MGDPKKIRKKYETPMHPWQGSRIDAEKPLMKIYGLSNKKELWRIGSKLKAFKDNAKSLVARKGTQAEMEKKQLFDKLKSLNLLDSDSLDAVLGMNIEQLLDRRLQTLVFKQGLARSTKQARQMITHGHIIVADKKMTAPSYLVRITEQDKITYSDNSAFKVEDHPERIVAVQKAEKTKESEEAEKKREEKKVAEAKKEEPKVEAKKEKVESKDEKDSSQSSDSQTAEKGAQE